MDGAPARARFEIHGSIGIDAEVGRLGARYLVGFPRAYASLVAWPGLRHVYSVAVAHPAIVQEPTLVVYHLVSFPVDRAPAP